MNQVMSFREIANCLTVPILIGWLALALNSTSAYSQDEPPSKTMTLDKDRVIFQRIEDSKPVASESFNSDEFLAYNELLAFASQFTSAELEQNARRDLHFKDLFHPIRKEYRLDLVYLTGRLMRLRSIGPTKPLKDAGITELYEGWMFPKNEPNPVAILFTSLPEGLSPQKDLAKDKLDRWVGFAGYSFKLIAYESSEVQINNPMQNRVRLAPLLMGKAPTFIGPQANEISVGWHQTFLPIVLIAIGALAICVIGLGWWYRRGDAYLKETLANQYEKNPFAG